MLPHNIFMKNKRTQYWLRQFRNPRPPVFVFLPPSGPMHQVSQLSPPPTPSHEMKTRSTRGTIPRWGTFTPPPILRSNQRQPTTLTAIALLVQQLGKMRWAHQAMVTSTSPFRSEPLNHSKTLYDNNYVKKCILLWNDKFFFSWPSLMSNWFLKSLVRSYWMVDFLSTFEWWINFVCTWHSADFLSTTTCLWMHVEWLCQHKP